MSSRPSCTPPRSKSMAMTSTRGSQRSTAPRIAVSMRPTIAASIVSKTRSCTSQPNSGRIGRSPGAVPRMISSACSMSVSPVAMATAPRWSTDSGKARPDPSTSDIPPSKLSDVDRGAGDRDAACRELDLRRAALQRKAHLALDGHVGALTLDRDGVGDVERQVAVDGHGARVRHLDRQRTAALDGEVLGRLQVGLVVALDREGALLVLQEVVAGLVLAVEQRAQDERAAHVAVLEADEHLVADLGHHQQAALVAGVRRRDARP